MCATGVLKFDCAFNDMRTYLLFWVAELSRCGLAEFIGRLVALLPNAHADTKRDTRGK